MSLGVRAAQIRILSRWYALPSPPVPREVAPAGPPALRAASPCSIEVTARQSLAVSPRIIEVWPLTPLPVRPPGARPHRWEEEEPASSEPSTGADSPRPLTVGAVLRAGVIATVLLSALTVLLDACG